MSLVMAFFCPSFGLFLALGAHPRVGWRRSGPLRVGRAPRRVHRPARWLGAVSARAARAPALRVLS